MTDDFSEGLNHVRSGQSQLGTSVFHESARSVSPEISGLFFGQRTHNSLDVLADTHIWAEDEHFF